ncbi:hemicentin-1-like [Anticarsia gemmatalis]|uniref:hemicentin-1-like n=1 Tax=Anticarsia gemmatalis TaxID=129554 RepID=UPI003F75E527
MIGRKSVVLLLLLVICAECKRKGRSTKDDGKSSLAFVFDITGSMYNDLRQVREGAEMILNTALKESNVIADFVFVPFHDPAVGPATVTRNKEVFKKALNIVRVYGGGDCPEMSLTGIHMALNVSRPRSFIYVFTDATSIDHKKVGAVLDTVQRKQSQVVFILTGHCNDLDKPTYKVYQQVAAASSGQIFNLNKTSVHKMLDFVRSSIKGRTVNLASASNPAGFNYTQEIPIDSTLGEVTVSVSGSKPQITVVDPKGEQLTGPPKLITTLDLSEIMVVKVMQPEPGNWTITVGSEEDYSVKVVGLSNLTFNHGFSVEKPSSMKETSYRPLKSTYNHMMISLTQTNITVELQHADVVSLNGSTLFELPLTLVDRDNKVYLAPSFIPPDEFFYIAINGRDQYGQELRRMGATAIQAKVPDVPYLTAPRQVQAHSHTRVVLTCNVESLVPVTAMWTNHASRILQRVSSLQTTSLELVVDDMKEEHVGTYRCVAQNTAGISKADTELDIIVDLPQVTIDPENITVEVGDNITITCSVYSEALLTENKLTFKGIHTDYETDLSKEPNIEALYMFSKTIQVNENDTGIYSCIATNRGGKTIQSTHITLKPNPSAQILGPHTLSKPIHSDIQLVCVVENAQVLVWTMPNGVEVRRVEVNGSYNDILDVKNVTHGGVWTCTAWRGVKKGSDSVSLTILLKPVVSIIGDKNITVVNGTTVQVTCRVEAKPVPRILWHRETEEFLNNDLSQLSDTIYQSVLTLDSSKIDVSGTYFCFGENSEGIHQDSVDVRVRRKMNIVEGFKDQSVQLYYQIELPCIIDTFPPPTTLWYHNGTSLVTTDNVHVSEDNTTVYIKRVEFNDLGEYICRVQNEYESVEVRGTVTVEGLAPPQISKEPVQVTAREGQSTIITCRVLQGNPEPTITWEHKTSASKQFSSLPAGVAVNDNYELSISNVSEQHAGVYRCVADNVLGTDAYDVELLVQYPPKFAHNLEEDEVPQDVKLGDKVSLPCKASGVPPPVTVWTKDGRPIVYTDNILTQEKPDSTRLKDVSKSKSELKILQVKEENSGVYICEATNPVGQYHHNFTLDVQYPPKLTDVIEEADSPKEVKVGEKVLLSCKASGVPPPVTVWTKDGRPIVYTDNISLNEAKELSIDRVSAEDSGIYTCNVTSPLGSTHRNFTVNVYEPPSIPAPVSSVQEALEGQLVQLPCTAHGVPTPELTWTRNGEPIGKEKHVEGFGLRFIPKLSDSGEYTCTAVNEHGNTSVTYTLDVKVPPHIVPPSEPTKQVLLGSDVTLKCDVTGHTTVTPTINWKYKPKDSEEFTSLPKEVVVNKFELSISNVSEQHAGVYRCVADNVLGRDSYDVELLVQYPPKLTNSTKGSSKPKEIKVGEQILLSCEASGVPPPVTVWTKDGRPIVYTDNISLTDASELLIKKASVHNSGTYTCNITSALGSTHKNITVKIYEPPSIPAPVSSVQEALEGQLVQLPCTARGVPTPELTWTHNGDALGDDKYVDGYGLRFVANLTDFGDYTCIAENEHGNTSISYTLHVWVPPFIIPLSEPAKEVLVGSEVTLQCDVIGFPVPTVQWMFDGEILTENTTDLSFNDIGNVYINKARMEHEGVYVCIAENAGGIAEQPIYLAVNELPKILEDNYTGPVVGTNVDLELSVACRATGKPQPYIMWAKDEFYLNKDPRYTIDSDGTLHIHSPSEDMSGHYTCVARNDVGAINKTIPVEIYSLPTPTQSDQSPTIVTLLEGTDGTINCPIRATSHSVKWYQNAKLISTGPFELHNISRLHASNYSCVVTNVVGSASAKIQVVVEWRPSFVKEEGRDIERVRGDDIEFDCEVDAKPSAKTRWWFNSKQLVFEDKSSLKLINVELHHEGIYKCVVNNVHGTVVREYHLKVLEPPFISDFDVMDVQLKEGDNATLECNAKGTPAPTITWTYNNTNWQTQNNIIFASNITTQHEGIYRCDATNTAGATHIVYRVSVVYVATVVHMVAYVGGVGATVADTVQVVQGTSIRVACIASGNPVPDIQWVRQGRAVSENMFDIQYADLTLSRVDTSDAGVYTCVASNEGGSDSRRIKLDVLEPPKIFQSLFENSTQVTIQVISGQSFYLHCHPYGNPLPEVYWFKNDVPLKLFDDTMVSTEFGEVIAVRAAIEEQSGNYSCVARNIVGDARVDYEVEVLVPPPAPKDGPRKVTARFGQPLTLACPSMGTRPDVMWIKHPYTELTDDHRVTLLDHHFTLVINKTEVTDSGKYSCILTNMVGTTEVTFDVVVHKPPSIAGNVGNNIVEGHVVPLRRSIVLKCEADGHPRPKITWLKDTQKLSESVSNIQRVLGNSLLAIWSAGVRDAGQYICVAENIAGTAHRRYNVAVQVPAKWSPWSAWSLCNVTCGLGHQTRSRMCHYIDDNNHTIVSSSHSEKIVLDESACKGPTDDRRKCHMPPCAVDESVPKWSQWSKWSECSATCGVGTQARTRKCKTKAKCIGDNVQIRKCAELPLCNASPDSSDNDVFDSTEDISDSNPYIPDMTFEMQPEVINSHYSSDVEEFYSASNPGSQSSPGYFDVEVTSNLDGSDRGPCDPGYTHNVTANTCEDVDECTVEKNSCHLTQVCVNTEGAYRCSCSPGFLSLGVGQRCLDIDECNLQTDGCEYSCVNTAGGYVCACPRHLRLHLDRHHCVTPALYRRPYGELESEYLSTTIDLPTKYTRP